MEHRVTLRTIAADMGLSPQAISMALRDHQDIAAATRERVKARARELGYRPDPGLRALADYRTRHRAVSSRWNRVALVHNWLSESTARASAFHRDWLRHIQRATKARGIETTVHGLGSRCEKAPAIFRRLHHRGITGVFLAPPELTPDEPKVEIPHGLFQVVTFGPGHLYQDHHAVQFDFYENLRLAWRTLVAHGRRRIGLVYHKRQGWRTGHAWLAAYHVEKTLAGHRPEELPPLELGAEGVPEERAAYLAWVKRHRFDAVISSLYELYGWNAALAAPP